MRVGRASEVRARRADCSRHFSSPEGVVMKVELLESRRLLAVTASLVDHVLTVTGDAESNRVGISRGENNTIVVRSRDVTLLTAASADVNSIRVSMLGGNDVVEIAQAI